VVVLFQYLPLISLRTVSCHVLLCLMHLELRYRTTEPNIQEGVADTDFNCFCSYAGVSERRERLSKYGLEYVNTQTSVV
jgi:hypothetical protein